MLDAQPSPAALAQAAAMHRTLAVADAHVDTVLRMLDEGYDLASAPETAHLSWEKIAAAGLNLQIFACFVAPDCLPDDCAERVDRLLDRFAQETARFPDRLTACRSREEIFTKELILHGILSIQSGDNPRMVRQKLMTYLPPKLRQEQQPARQAA